MALSSWTEARRQMLLDATVVNLNTGSFGPLPRPVFELVTGLRLRLAEEPMDFLLRQAPPLLAQARQALALFLHADPRRLIFTANATAAVNMVAAGLRLTGPGEILLSDHEYGAMHWCWERAAQRQGLTLRTFALPHLPGTPEEIVDAARIALSPRTRLLFFSHVVSPTGLVLPARLLCDEARRRGVLTCIDGAHAPAMLALDVDGLGCDFYAGNCHKWLLAPTGAGFLCLGPDSAARFLPQQVSWGWHYDPARADEPDEFGSTPRIRAFEFEGTRDPCAWLAVPAAIAFQEKLGMDAIRARIAELVGHVRERLGTLGLPLATPPDDRLHGALTAFELPLEVEGRALQDRLWNRHRIEVPVISKLERLLLRVSTHFYNTEEEVDRLAEALADR